MRGLGKLLDEGCDEIVGRGAAQELIVVEDQDERLAVVDGAEEPWQDLAFDIDPE